MATDQSHADDVKVLHSMGYAQELSRRMSGFSNFAISFSIICILSGGINSFAQATSSIGGAGAGIGWIECQGCAADALVQILNPIQERRAKYTPAEVEDILKDGANRARNRAEQTMSEVRTAMQLIPAAK